MPIRNIVKIDEDKCNGCGLCIPNCAEGAIKLIDGKARLVDDKFCDGLGACLGHCPQDAITIIQRDAKEFDEDAVKAYHQKTQHQMSRNKPRLHQDSQCPGSRTMDFRGKGNRNAYQSGSKADADSEGSESELRQWPVQLTLVSPNASFFKDADLLVSADCVPFSYPGFHREFLKNKTLVIGCPKLDDAQFYVEKLSEILKANNIKSITLVNMEVPCCFGLQHIVEESVKRSGRNIPVNQTIISINGEKLNF